MSAFEVLGFRLPALELAKVLREGSPGMFMSCYTSHVCIQRTNY